MNKKLYHKAWRCVLATFGIIPYLFLWNSSKAMAVGNGVGKVISIQQIVELWKGLRDGVEIIKFDDFNKFRDEAMHHMRLAALRDVDLTWYTKSLKSLSCAGIAQLYHCEMQIRDSKLGRDWLISKGLDPEDYNVEQVMLYSRAIRYNLDLSDFTNSNIEAEQLRWIILGLRDGYPINIYSDWRSYSGAQMGILYAALRADVDPSKINYPRLFSDLQMRLLLTAEIIGVDSGLIAHPGWTPEMMMRDIRKMVEDEKWIERMNTKEEQIKTLTANNKRAEKRRMDR